MTATTSQRPPAPALRRLITGPAPEGSRWRAAEVVMAWLAARVVVGTALALVRFISGHAVGGSLKTTNLLGWDAGWYETIAAHGYGGAGHSSLRFFPLLPMVVRGIDTVPGLSGHAGAVLVTVVNIAALGLLFALVRLCRVEGLSDAVTSRVVWFAALAPPAFVLVMGYAEALSGLLAVCVFLGARTRRFEIAAVAGLLAGLCRPVGVLLAAAVAVEAARGWSDAGLTERARRVVAVLAPVAGAGAYLLWVGATYGDMWAPIRLQRQAGLHGSSFDPFRVLLDAAKGTVHGQVGTGLHVPWLILAVAGVVVMARRLPASYTVWSALTVAAVLTGSNLDSSERYVYGAFPFVILVAMLTGRRLVWQGVLVVSTTLMLGYALLAFLTLYVP